MAAGDVVVDDEDRVVFVARSGSAHVGVARAQAAVRARGVSESSLTYLSWRWSVLKRMRPDVAARAVTVSQKSNDRLLTVHAARTVGCILTPASEPLT